MTPVVLRARPWPGIRLAALSLLMAGGGLWFALAGTGAFTRAVGVVGVALFGAGLVLGSWQAVRRPVVLVVDAEGFDHRSSLAGGRVRWEDVAGAVAHTLVAQPLVTVFVREGAGVGHDVPLPESAGPADGGPLGRAVNIAVRPTGLDGDRVVALLREGHAAWRAGRSGSGTENPRG